MLDSVTVRLYAQARTAAGSARLTLDVPPNGLAMSAFLAALASARPGLRPVLGTCRVAVNDAYVEASEARIRPGDDVAIHPPYSGG